MSVFSLLAQVETAFICYRGNANDVVAFGFFWDITCIPSTPEYCYHCGLGLLASIGGLQTLLAFECPVFCRSAVSKSWSWHFCKVPFVRVTKWGQVDQMQWKSNISLNIVLFVSAVSHFHDMDVFWGFFLEGGLKGKTQEPIFSSRLVHFYWIVSKMHFYTSSILQKSNVPSASLENTLHCD